jgi:hypothetical protein
MASRRGRNPSKPHLPASSGGNCACRKPVPPGQMRRSSPSARSRVGRRAGRCWRGRGCDDLRLVGLKLIFLIVSRTVSLLRLSRRDSWWKDAEILMLRHQLSVALRERPRAHPRLTWPDRAWLALLAGTMPIERLAAMQFIVTPGTILRCHRDIVRRRWPRRSRRGRSGRPATYRRVRSVVLRLGCAGRHVRKGPGGTVPAARPHVRRRGSTALPTRNLRACREISAAGLALACAPAAASPGRPG